MEVTPTEVTRYRVRVHSERHRIEEVFHEGKGEVGLAHYEVRSWVGWHHHMTLSLLALWFLCLEKRRLGKKNTGDYSPTSTADFLRVSTRAYRPLKYDVFVYAPQAGFSMKRGR